MKKTRAKKGERFWRIWAMDNHFEIRDSIDDYGAICNQMFAMGNYFHTQKEAESMARKLRAVLNGADVIEMPSEEEWRTEAIKIGSRNSVEYEQEDAVSYNECVSSAIEMVLWLESKIIK